MGKNTDRGSPRSATGGSSRGAVAGAGGARAAGARQRGPPSETVREGRATPPDGNAEAQQGRPRPSGGPGRPRRDATAPFQARPQRPGQAAEGDSGGARPQGEGAARER